MGTKTDTTETSAGQVTKNAAEVYDEFFLPALFDHWAPRVAEAAGVEDGARVLDVACGTGSFALEAAGRVGFKGSAGGLDRNAEMLAVARRKAPELDWRLGLAEDLPYDDEAFDAVGCQFGMMYFDDAAAAVGEMRRVLAPGGRMAVTVWDALDKSPGYARLTELVDRMFGDEAAQELRAPFEMGDADAMRKLFGSAGADDVDVASTAGTARFPSLESWLHTEVKGWTLGEKIDDDDEYASLVKEAKAELDTFVGPDGSVVFPLPALMMTARRM